MVDTCTAVHLQQRGFDVTLVDRRSPGQETSMGNAGLIQRQAIEPYAFPRDLDDQRFDSTIHPRKYFAMKKL